MHKQKFYLFYLLGLLIFSVPQISAQTNWYVDKNANGSNTGTSLSNAWTSFSSINWTKIGTDGITDSIYISAGTYNETLNIPPNKSNIVIASIGKVIIDGQNTRDFGINLSGGSYTNIKIYGFTVQNALYRLISITNASNYSPIKNVVVEACSLYNYKSYGIFVEADGGGSEDDSYVTLKGNYLNDDNNFSGQSDGIYIQNLDSARVTRNTVINDNPTNPGSIDVDWHSDDLQTYRVNSIIVDNNFLYMENQYKGIGTQVLFTAEVFDRPGIHVYYNNVIIRNVPNAYDWAIRTKGNDGKTVYILNNTYIGYGRVQGADCTGYLENNIFYAFPGSKWDSFSSIGASAERSHNLVYDENGSFGSMPGSVEDNPLFVNKSYKSFDGRLLSGSYAINSGKNIKTLVESFGLEWKDINGIARTSTPNIGAFSKDGSTTGISSTNEAPNSFKLSQNYPNPFNPSTKIKFNLPSSNNVKLTIYDITGKEVTQLVNQELAAGVHTVDFNASNLASGTYIYRIQAGSYVQSKKMILLK